MLKECLEVFEKKYEEIGDKLILDSYIPEDGTYLIIGTDKEEFYIKEQIEIKYNKKNRELFCSNEDYLEKIRKYNYLSKLVEMNKPIDGKKTIHTNNYLSFAIKKDKFPKKENEEKKLNVSIIEGYYSILKNPYLKYKDGKPKKIYEEIEASLGKPDIQLIDKIEMWIKGNIFTIDIDKSRKDYLKIFFEYPIEDYEREANRYIIPNIYNKNEYNQIINNEVYGLPSNNMGLNAKKPYLENKTRKVVVPYLIDKKEVLLEKKFFDYLMTFAEKGKYNIYIDNKEIVGLENTKLLDRDFSGIFLRIQKGKELEIISQDIITGYKYKFQKPLKFENILNLTENMMKDIEYNDYVSKEKIQALIHEIFFSKCLINNYFTEAKDMSIKDNILKENILVARIPLFNWLYKDIESNARSVISKISLSCIKNSICRGFIPKASNQFNLRIALEDYFYGGSDMADKVKNIRETLKSKINGYKLKKDTDEERYIKLESDDEYFFAVGQFVNYLLSRSKAKSKPQSLINPFLNAKTDKVIKGRLVKLYMKYNYDFEQTNKKVGSLYAMISSYEVDGKVNQDMIIAGYLHSNLIYEKAEV